MTVKEFIDSKIDWKAYNMMLDGITVFEDAGISCEIDITIFLTHIDGKHSIPYENRFYLYRKGELIWNPGSIQTYDNKWHFNKAEYYIEFNNYSSKKTLYDTKTLMDNLMKRVSRRLELKQHGFTLMTFVQKN